MMAMCAPIQVSQPSHSHAPSQKTPLVQPPQSPMQTKSHRNRRVDIIPHNASIDDFSQKQVTGPLNFSRVQNVVKDGHRKPSNKNLNLGRDTKKNQTNIMFSEFSTKKKPSSQTLPFAPAMAPIPGSSRMSQRLQDTLMRYGQAARP